MSHIELKHTVVCFEPFYRGSEKAMEEWLLQTWSVINANAGGISAVAAVLVPAGSFIAWLKRRPKSEKLLGPQVRGGKGGDASVGGNGVAFGGRGGRSGLHGIGGDGGAGQVSGDGVAIGGDGGDAGTPWRPALGAPSPLERMQEIGSATWSNAARDEFGLFVVGRGGSGGDIGARVLVNGVKYPLLPLVQLLRLWAPNILDQADATNPDGPQTFWDTVAQLDPLVAHAAEAHVSRSIEVAGRPGEAPPDPYARRVPMGELGSKAKTSN